MELGVGRRVLTWTGELLRRLKHRQDAQREGRNAQRGAVVAAEIDPLRAPYPALEDFAEKGAYYLPQDRSLVRRHVETVTLRGERSGMRRLTVDVVLPRDTELAIAEEAEGYRFYVPIALIAKTPPTTNMDLKDEGGPLPPAPESRAKRSADVRRPAEDGIGPDGRRATNGVRQGSQATRLRRRPSGELCARIALIWLDEHYNDRLQPKDAQAFRVLLSDFSGNSLLWIGLSGRPGARRVIKLGHDISTARAARPADARPGGDGHG